MGYSLVAGSPLVSVAALYPALYRNEKRLGQRVSFFIISRIGELCFRGVSEITHMQKGITFHRTLNISYAREVVRFCLDNISANA